MSNDNATPPANEPATETWHAQSIRFMQKWNEEYPVGVTVRHYGKTRMTTSSCVVESDGTPTVAVSGLDDRVPIGLLEVVDKPKKKNRSSAKRKDVFRRCNHCEATFYSVQNCPKCGRPTSVLGS